MNIITPIPSKLLNVYTASDNESLTVNWNPSDEPDLKDYAVWISTTENFDPATTAPTWTGTALTCTVKGLTASTNYYVRITARDVWKDAVWNYSDQLMQRTTDS